MPSERVVTGEEVISDKSAVLRPTETCDQLDTETHATLRGICRPPYACDRRMRSTCSAHMNSKTG